MRLIKPLHVSGYLAHAIPGKVWQLLAIVIILLLAILIRLPLAETPGYTDDVNRYMERSWKASTFGIGSTYTDDYKIKATNNLPGLVYVFEAVGMFHRAFVDPSFPAPLSNAYRNPDHRFLLRIPAILADLVTGLLIFVSARRRAGALMGLLLMATFVLNPAIVFVSALAGQTQGIYIVLIVAAFVAIEWRQPVIAWFAIALAAGTKPQAWIFLPVVAILTLRLFGWRKLVEGGVILAAIWLLLVAPIVRTGNWPDLVDNMFFVSNKNNDVDHSAHNIWYLVVQTETVHDSEPFPPLESMGLPWLTYRHVALAALGLVELVVLFVLWRRPDAVHMYLWSAFLFCGFVILSTNMHQWYLVGALPLLLLAAAEAPGWLWLYIVFSITATLNMALHYPSVMTWLVPAAAKDEDAANAPLAIPRLANAATNVALFVTWAILLTRRNYLKLGVRGDTG
ncbi:MAG: hypothetical protein U0822_26625 [Anaerolineae bacterium]